VASERIEELKRHFNAEHELSILIHLYINYAGKLAYAEYPYIPIKSLIKMDRQIEIVYWEIIPLVWDSDGNAKEYGQVNLGFRIPTTSDEFCSESNAKMVVQGFLDLFNNMSRHFERHKRPNGSLYAQIDGDLKAKFFKHGRYFDVELR
jgi:hypothetical protein